VWDDLSFCAGNFSSPIQCEQKIFFAFFKIAAIYLLEGDTPPTPLTPQ